MRRFLLVACLGPFALFVHAAHAQTALHEHAAVSTKTIDGTAHPELIPYATAYRRPRSLRLPN